MGLAVQKLTVVWRFYLARQFVHNDTSPPPSPRTVTVNVHRQHATRSLYWEFLRQRSLNTKFLRYTSAWPRERKYRVSSWGRAHRNSLPYRPADRIDVLTHKTQIFMCFICLRKKQLRLFLYQIPYFSISFLFSTGFLFKRRVKSTPTVTGVELR